MLERKIRYDGSVAEYHCKLIEKDDQYAVLYYAIPKPFSIKVAEVTLVVPEGSYTTAYYWKDRNYNVYVLRDARSQYLGSYFNIVRNTVILDTTVTYEDLIVDLLVFPDGKYYVLDEDELPEPLTVFEDGLVNRALNQLIESLDDVLGPLKN